MKRTQHWGRIHKWAFWDMWELLSPAERKLISADKDHVRNESKGFFKKVELLADRRYEDAAYPLNSKSSFQYAYWE